MFYIYCMILSLLYSIQYMLATYSQHNIIEYSHKLCKKNHLWYCLKILHFIKYIKTKSTIPILTFSPIFPQRNISLYLISALHNRSLMFHSQFNAHIQHPSNDLEHDCQHRNDTIGLLGSISFLCFKFYNIKKTQNLYTFIPI